MAGASNLPKTEAQLKRMAEAFGQAIETQLRKKRKRVSISVKWKKSGGAWVPKKATKKTYTGNTIASGNLVESIKVVGSGLAYDVQMADYAKYVISGRKKGKGIPIQAMQKWIKDKRLRPRVNGKFAKVKGDSYKTMGYLMNRKIKYFGIEGFDFVEPARKDVLSRYKGALTKAMGIDLKNIMIK